MRFLWIFAIALTWIGAGVHPVSAEQTVVVVLDDSGSMSEWMRSTRGRLRRMDAAKQALLEVLDNLPLDTSVGVLALNSRVNGSNWIVPLGDTSTAGRQDKIRRIEADGGTPLGEFLRVGADELLRARSSQSYGNYRLLVVTDGEANDGELVEAYVPQILARGIILDVIGVDMAAQHSLATQAHSYRRADDEASLTQAISEVFAETSADDQQAQEDFELIAGLPDGFAEQALQALTKQRNDPIEAANTRRGDVFGLPNTRGGNNVLGRLFGTVICCFGTFLGVGLLLVILLGQRKPPRRRKGGF